MVFDTIAFMILIVFGLLSILEKKKKILLRQTAWCSPSLKTRKLQLLTILLFHHFACRGYSVIIVDTSWPGGVLMVQSKLLSVCASENNLWKCNH